MTVVDPGATGVPRIAVILATPPGFNPGMAATELAVLAFLKRHGFLSEARFYRLVGLAERLRALPADVQAGIARQAETGVGYESAVDGYDDIIGSDVVLFWADFLHMAHYQRSLVKTAGRLASPPLDKAGASRLVRKLFLLSEADDSTLGRALTFGTTLLFNTAADQADPDYGEPLRRFMTHARRVWVRDALSAARVAHLRRDYRSGYLGVDAASLLRREDLIGMGEGEAARSGGMLVFLGRDPAVRDGMMHVARRLADVLGRPPAWLPWGGATAFPNLAAAPIPLATPIDADTLQLLRAVANASLVVTDTYHLALLAWSLGVPAVATFSGSGEAAADVSCGARFNWRDKREVFFSQYDALEFLIRPEELTEAGRLSARLSRLEATVQDPSLRAAVSGGIRSHAETVEVDLADEIRAMLSR